MFSRINTNVENFRTSAEQHIHRLTPAHAPSTEHEEHEIPLERAARPVTNVALMGILSKFRGLKEKRLATEASASMAEDIKGEGHVAVSVRPHSKQALSCTATPEDAVISIPHCDNVDGKSSLLPSCNGSRSSSSSSSTTSGSRSIGGSSNSCSSGREGSSQERLVTKKSSGPGPLLRSLSRWASRRKNSVEAMETPPQQPEMPGGITVEQHNGPASRPRGDGLPVDYTKLDKDSNLEHSGGDDLGGTADIGRRGSGDAGEEGGDDDDAESGGKHEDTDGIIGGRMTDDVSWLSLGKPDKGIPDDPGEAHISELYRATLAKEMSVSRKLWDTYTDPSRQRARAARGLAPSVLIGTVDKHAGFFGARRPPLPRRTASCDGNGGWVRRFKDRLGAVPMMYPTASLPVLLSLLAGIADCTYSAFFIPVTTVFRITLTSWNAVTITDTVAAVIFTMEIAAFFSTGLVIVNSLRQAVVMDRHMVAVHYMYRGSFIVDLLAVVPLWVEVVVVAFGDSASQDVLNVLNVMRLFRLLRLIRVSRAAILNSFMPTAVRWLPSGLGYLLNLAFTAAMFINALACVWYYTARMEDIGAGGTWLSFAGNGDNSDMQSASSVDQFVAAVYWATTTIATVGYGDITPVTTAERIVATCIMLLGVLFFGFLIGAVGEFLEHVSANAESGRLFRQKMEGVDRWMEARNLPKHMRREITCYYSDIWARHTAFHDNAFFTDLPAALRGKIVRYRTRAAVAKSMLGQALGPRALLVLSSVMLPVSAQPGHDLCRQGSPADCLWFLTEGSVLAISYGRSLVRITAPAVLGESALLGALAAQSPQRPLTYRASTSCCLWELEVGDVLRMKALQPTMAEDLAAFFLDAAEHGLDDLSEDHMQAKFPKCRTRESVLDSLHAELRQSQHPQTVSEAAVSSLDLDSEAIGGRRIMALPTTEQARHILDKSPAFSRGLGFSSGPAALRDLKRRATNLLVQRTTKDRTSKDQNVQVPLHQAGSQQLQQHADHTNHADSIQVPLAAPLPGGNRGGNGIGTDQGAAHQFHEDAFDSMLGFDRKTQVDPEQNSMVEAAVWALHSTKEDDEARAAQRVATTHRRLQATLASTQAVAMPPGPKVDRPSGTAPRPSGEQLATLTPGIAAGSKVERPLPSDISATQQRAQQRSRTGSLSWLDQQPSVSASPLPRFGLPLFSAARAGRGVSRSAASETNRAPDSEEQRQQLRLQVQEASFSTYDNRRP